MTSASSILLELIGIKNKIKSLVLSQSHKLHFLERWSLHKRISFCETETIEKRHVMMFLFTIDYFVIKILSVTEILTFVKELHLH